MYVGNDNIMNYKYLHGSAFSALRNLNKSLQTYIFKALATIEFSRLFVISSPIK